MTRKDKLVTVKEGPARRSAGAAAQVPHRESAGVNDAFQLRGLITVKDIQKARDNPDSATDSHERLRVGAAVGVGGDTEDRVGPSLPASI